MPALAAQSRRCRANLVPNSRGAAMAEPMRRWLGTADGMHQLAEGGAVSRSAIRRFSTPRDLIMS
jgi:hypothetical protein